MERRSAFPLVVKLCISPNYLGFMPNIVSMDMEKHYDYHVN